MIIYFFQATTSKNHYISHGNSTATVLAKKTQKKANSMVNSIQAATVQILAVILENSRVMESTQETTEFRVSKVTNTSTYNQKLRYNMNIFQQQPSNVPKPFQLTLSKKLEYQYLIQQEFLLLKSLRCPYHNLTPYRFQYHIQSRYQSTNWCQKKSKRGCLFKLRNQFLYILRSQ